ncbi:MAG: hypothetical protein AAFY02_02395 [Pseudomonadota bacterium]
MRSSRFYLLLIVTALALLGAVAVTLEQRSPSSLQVLGTAAFPLLAEDPSAAARVTVVTSEGSYALERSAAPGLWLLPEAGGYPVERQAITGLLVRLARLQLFEAKTALPDRLELLGLAGPEAGPDQGRRLVILDSDGGTLVDAVIGPNRDNLDGLGGGGTYLRYADSDQAWLALGEVSVPAEGPDFLDRVLVNLPGSIVAQMTVEPPDGDVSLTARRSERGALGLSLDPAPPAGMVVEDFLLRQMAGSFERLTFRAVRPAEDLALPEPWRVTVTTFDGIQVTLTLQQIEGAVWGRLEATAVAPPLEPGGPPREDAAAFAADLAARSDGWVYQLEPLLLQRLAQRRQDLVSAVGE